MKKLKEIDISSMTPLEALNCLSLLKEKAGDDSGGLSVNEVCENGS